jgi:hypothetical protein
VYVIYRTIIIFSLFALDENWHKESFLSNIRLFQARTHGGGGNVGNNPPPPRMSEKKGQQCGMFTRIVLCSHAQCDVDTYECDYDTHESDNDTHTC